MEYGSCPVCCPCEWCGAVFTVDEILKKLNDAVDRDTKEINEYVQSYYKKRYYKKNFALLLNSWFQEDRMHPQPILTDYIYKLVIKFGKNGMFYEEAMRKYFNKEITDVLDIELCKYVIDLKGNVRCRGNTYFLRNDLKRRRQLIENENKRIKLI